MSSSCKCENGCCAGKLFDGLTAQFLAIINQKIPRGLTREGMKRVVDHPEIAEELLRGFEELKPFQVCGTIEVGGISWGEFSKSLRMALTPAAKNVLESVPVPEEIRPVRISMVSPNQMGFAERASFLEVMARAEKLGLERLHPMAGAILALLYKGNVPLNVAMGSVLCSDGVRRRLVVARHNCLETIVASDDMIGRHDLIAIAASPTIKGDDKRLHNVLEG
jgi:hypothetical protein